MMQNIGTFSELTNKISALKVFKDQINDAIRDEQEAQRKYDKMLPQADKAGAKFASSQIRSIRGQEHTHEGNFRDMLRNTEQSITEDERTLQEDQRRLADEQKREMEEQRERLNRAHIDNIRRRGSGYG
jgi:rubrerythrin